MCVVWGGGRWFLCLRLPRQLGALKVCASPIRSQAPCGQGFLFLPLSPEDLGGGGSRQRGPDPWIWGSQELPGQEVRGGWRTPTCDPVWGEGLLPSGQIMFTAVS